MATQFKPLEESQYLNNPGYLKLDLMIRGARIHPSLFEEGMVLPSYRLSPSTYGNVTLILPDETWVSVPYQEEDIQNSPYEIILFKGKHYIKSPYGSLRVKLLKAPSFYDKKVNEKVTIGQVAVCHGNGVSLSMKGHRYLLPHLIDPHDPQKEDLHVTVEETVALLKEIRKDRKIDVVTISSWTTHEEDGGILEIEPYLRAIKEEFNVLLFVEVHLPHQTSIIDRTYAMGADSVCYHIGDLCSHGAHEESSRKPLKEELKLLKHAVKVFPQGTILSHLTMGTRPVEDVMKDVDELTKIKVLPILTVESREVVLQEKLTTKHLAPLFGYVYNQVKAQKVKMNWFSKLSSYFAPIEGRYFAGDTPKFKLALMNFYQSSAFGGSISSSLSNLRRKLRVREVKD